MTIKQTTPQSSITVSTAGYISKDLVRNKFLPDVLLGLIIKVPDDSGEDIVGIRISYHQLLGLKREIDLHLQKIGASSLEKQQIEKTEVSIICSAFEFKLRPELVIETREKDSLFEAITRIKDANRNCSLYASGKGSSKETAVRDLDQNIERFMNNINAQSNLDGDLEVYREHPT